MAIRYEPREGAYIPGPPLDPKRCVASVSDHTGFRFYQCQRKRVVGEWCKQHSPEAEQARRDKAAERWERRSRCVGCANKDAEIAALTEENRRLSAWLRHIDGGDHPCTDQSTLRQWAYVAVTLHWPAPGEA